MYIFGNLLTKLTFFRFPYFQRRSTYICDQGNNPEWFEQRFIFDVPEEAVESMRKYKLRVHVMSKSTVGIGMSVGKADIQFSCLVGGESVEGWVPLRPAKSSLQYMQQWAQIIGSVRVRLRLVRNISDLCLCYATEIFRYFLIYPRPPPLEYQSQCGRTGCRYNLHFSLFFLCPVLAA